MNLRTRRDRNLGGCIASAGREEFWLGLWSDVACGTRLAPVIGCSRTARVIDPGVAAELGGHVCGIAIACR